MLIKTLKYTLCAASVMTVMTTGVRAESLSEAVSFAVQNHPSVKALRQAENATGATVDEEKSNYYPTANVNASFGRLFANTTTTRGISVTRGAGYSWFGDGAVRLNQKIYDWSTTEHAINAAQSRFEAAGATTLTQETSIALQAMQAYLQLLRAETLLSKAKFNSTDMDDYYNRIKVSFDNGGADESEVSRAQDLVSLSSNIILRYESDLQIAQASYKEVVGRLPETDVVEPSLALSSIPASLEDAIDLSLLLNSQLKSAKMNTRANAYDLAREKSAVLPTLDAEFSANKRDQNDLVGGESEDVRGLVRANWDYSFGGAGKAAQDRASYTLKESEFNREALERAIARDVEVSWVSLNLAKQQKANEVDRLEAALQTQETFSEQYEGGQQKILDVMGAVNAAFLAEQDYLNIKFQEMNAAYTLMNVIGLPFTQEVASAK